MQVFPTMFSPVIPPLTMPNVPFFPNSCQLCTPHYVCPHHFRFSNISQQFCCHACYVFYIYQRMHR